MNPIKIIDSDGRENKEALKFMKDHLTVSNQNVIVLFAEF